MSIRISLELCERSSEASPQPRGAAMLEGQCALEWRVAGTRKSPPESERTSPNDQTVLCSENPGGGLAARRDKTPRPPCSTGGVRTQVGGVLPWDEARLMAETSPRRLDRHRRGAAGGWWRGTSQWRTFCSTCSPAIGGRQYRVRGDAQVRLRSGLEAPMKLRPLARHRPPNSSLPELDAIFIIPGAAKRHKRLLLRKSR